MTVRLVSSTTCVVRNTCNRNNVPSKSCCNSKKKLRFPNVLPLRKILHQLSFPRQSLCLLILRYLNELLLIQAYRSLEQIKYMALFYSSLAGSIVVKEKDSHILFGCRGIIVNASWVWYLRFISLHFFSPDPIDSNEFYCLSKAQFETSSSVKILFTTCHQPVTTLSKSYASN